jgi:hypothetical protein
MQAENFKPLSPSSSSEKAPLVVHTPPAPTSPTTTAAAAPTGGTRAFLAWEFILLCIVEVISSTSPLFRLAFSSEFDATTSPGLSIAGNMVRFFIWFFFSYRFTDGQLKKALGIWFTYDNILARAVAFSVCFIGLQLGPTATILQVFVIISDFFFTISFAGLSRLLLKEIKWTQMKLWSYKIQRLYAQTCFISVGCYFILKTPPSNFRNLFNLYL